MIDKQALLYSGKVKSLYTTEDPNRLIMHFSDQITGGDGAKRDYLTGKGSVNNRFNAFVMNHLQQCNIPTHFEAVLSPQESLVKRLDMLPVECVVRHVAAGSLCRRLGVEKGRLLEPATFEYFLKNDELHDPMINPSLAETLGFATPDQMKTMERLTHQIGPLLQQMFKQAGLILVDYKLEFGVLSDQSIVLGDEFTLDGCRVWEDMSGEKSLDKDRFREDQGGVLEAYRSVAERLGVVV